MKFQIAERRGDNVETVVCRGIRSIDKTYIYIYRHTRRMSRTQFVVFDSFIFHISGSCGHKDGGISAMSLNKCTAILSQTAYPCQGHSNMQIVQHIFFITRFKFWKTPLILCLAENIFEGVPIELFSNPNYDQVEIYK